MTMELQQPIGSRNAVRVSRRSTWSDTVWQFDTMRPGVPASARKIDWRFQLPDGSWFTDARWSELREAAKLYLWSLKSDPPGRVRCRDQTLAGRFRPLRILICWMVENGIGRFADLDEDAVTRFLAAIRTRPGKKSGAVSTRTLYTYARTIAMLHSQRGKLPDAPQADPFRFEPPGAVIGAKWDQTSGYPYTPDPLATALIAAAMRLIGPPADDVVTLRARAQRAYEAAIARGDATWRSTQHASAAIRTYRFATLPGEGSAWHPAISGTRMLRALMDRIYEACFVVIAYLVGARVSEILALRAGCIEQHPSGDGRESFTYLAGHIYKMAAGEAGQRHCWVAPEPVVRAIAVLESLSEPLRRRTGRDELWLSAFQPPSALLGVGVMHFTVPSAGHMTQRLNEHFAPFVALPDHEGARWHLSTHQGRKTFARFIGRKDRTGLHALQVHLGHVSRVMTDRGYVGTDFDLAELADGQALQETRAALEDLLTAPRLGGRAGRTIAARSPFRGRTRDGDVRAYVEFLIADSDMRLGVCDWGYCVYRRETSACLGNEDGPNPVLRTQSTCATCANFAVTEKHRPIWQARRRRNMELTQAFALDLESAALARDRLAECDRILDQLDTNITETDDAG
jgi:integrase